MNNKREDIDPDIVPVDGRGGPLGLMEPLLLEEGSRHRSRLMDLALELAQRSSGFRRSLPEKMVPALADLVRTMNCYYSNLIEGHATHPNDIDRALKNQYSDNPEKRDLQIEARAHVAVQAWIDAGGVRGRFATVDAIREIYRRFCEELPDSLRWVEDPSGREKIRIEPGTFRHQNVVVGQHVAVDWTSVQRFMRRFEEVYSNLGKTETLLASAAMHHRLVWIHPFLDGNGRVARLLSHATFVEVLETGAIWSVARGLARQVSNYKQHLASCDLPRRNDLDGRGRLSEEALAAFTEFFLKTCLDQVSFMEGLMDPSRLRIRVLRWAEEEIQLGNLPRNASAVLEVALYRGEVLRADLARIVGTGERQARRVVSSLAERGVLVSEGPRAPLCLAFPMAIASRFFPGLFPDQPS